MDPSGAVWLVTELDDGNGALVEVLQGTILTLAYDGERIAGSAGCNNYMGPAIIEEEVRIGPLVTTLMMCAEPEGIMQQETRFLELLQQTDSFQSDGDLLQLARGERVLAVMIPAPIELGGSWSLVAYSSGSEALVPLIAHTEITALFAEGRLRGHSGCNRYMTSFESEGQSLHISPPAGTRMICQLPDGLMAQEARFLELLPTTASYSVENGRLLDLFDGMGTRILQFTRA